jgi:hypothetical protein
MAAYKQQSDANLVADIQARKEFAQLWVPPPEEHDFREGSLDATEPQTHQQFVRNFMNPNTPNMRMHLMHSTGCHAPGTLIRVHGSANPRAVETLRLGELLVHPDGGFSRIKELHSGSGSMYRIMPRAHDLYVVNADHILRVYDASRTPADISVREYIVRAREYTDCFLAYVGDTGRTQYARFIIEYEGYGPFYGFTLSRAGAERNCADDALFLGADGLVLHNSGKCLGRGTRVRTMTRGIAPVEEITEQDVLVGDDGGARAVSHLARGYAECFRISAHPTSDFRPFVCNSPHVLTLFDEDEKHVFDIALDVFLQEFRARGEFHRFRMLRRRENGQFDACAFSIEPVGCCEYFGFTLDGNGRFLLEDGLVTHNTRAAISAAQECVKLYRYIYGANLRDSSVIMPSIFIIAFGGKQSFIRDLIKYSEFGYATVAEYETYMRLYRESVENEDAYKKYNDFYSMLKRRATNRAKGGFYKLLGYDEFANRLFGEDVAKLNTIIQDAHARKEPYSSALDRAVSEGIVKPDSALMARLENSMIIADEIHNTYNSQTINNRGLALQYVLDHARGVRFLSLSATPINSVPAEICDFINYFVAREDKIMRESLFSGHTLLPGALDRINELLRGHVSFLYDFDPHYFPRRIDKGITLHVRDQAGVSRALPYLKITPCVMSDYFVNTIRAFYGAARVDVPIGEEELDVDDEIVGIPQNAYSLFDMVFPSPTDAGSGLYNSATLFGAIHSAPQAWKNQMGIATKTTGGIHTFSGDFLRAETLEKYSAKYARMVALVVQLIRETGPCKIMIYHERVRMTGVLLVREILRANGMIDEHDESTSSTLCAICTQTRESHRDSAHEFRPLRFATLYSELDKTALTAIREKYNSSANLHGEWCSILIGSKLIRESYDFMAVRHLIVLSLPISISQLIQVFGRCVRRGSHAKLPENERNVQVHILVNSCKLSAETPDSARVDDVMDAPEIRRYALKLSSYLTVQKIGREMARNAVDAGINRNIITRPEQDSLGFLLYDEAIKFAIGDLRVDTFFAYGYGTQEIQFAIDIIKRLFRQQSIWDAQELARAVRNPPFGVWSNPALIADSSIVIALSFLLSSASNISGINDRAIVDSNGVAHLIVASASDADATGSAPLRARDYLFLAPIETTEVAGIAKSRALVDVESFIRGTQHESEDVIPIDQFELRTSFEESILSILRADYKVNTTRALTNVARLKSFLTRFSMDQQRVVMQHFVENAAQRDEFRALYTFLDALGVFVPYRFASKYRDVARRFDEAYAAARAPNDPVAFGDGASVRLFTGAEWVSLGRSALNMHIEYNENDVFVGIYKQFPYSIKFQIREPIQKLRAHSSKHRDARTIERGSICITKSRANIEHDAQRIGLRARDIRAALTANELCELIQDELLRREIKERADSHSLVKYVYGWWNAIPSPF